mmetsp:Transcript_45135/g.96039  ORF Transcript_45135/g.96039 Transcript_45135/m.96039 type:complete len:283 (-) Transcript_45135:1062-1910(-)
MTPANLKVLRALLPHRPVHVAQKVDVALLPIHRVVHEQAVHLLLENAAAAHEHQHGRSVDGPDGHGRGGVGRVEPTQLPKDAAELAAGLRGRDGHFPQGNVARPLPVHPLSPRLRRYAEQLPPLLFRHILSDEEIEREPIVEDVHPPLVEAGDAGVHGFRELADGTHRRGDDALVAVPARVLQPGRGDPLPIPHWHVGDQKQIGVDAHQARVRGGGPLVEYVVGAFVRRREGRPERDAAAPKHPALAQAEAEQREELQRLGKDELARRRGPRRGVQPVVGEH